MFVVGMTARNVIFQNKRYISKINIIFFYVKLPEGFSGGFI